MALTASEANAVNTVLDYASGVDGGDDVADRDVVTSAVAVLVSGSYKKLGAGLRDSDVARIVDALVERHAPAAPARPEPEWDDDEPASDADADGDLVVPSVALPEFEGQIPVAVVTKLNGTSQRIHRPLELGTKGVIVVEYEVDDVGHKRTDDGVKRRHTLKVLDAFELVGRPGKRLLNHLKERYRHGDEVDPLPFKHAGDGALVDGVVAGVTDGSGVALTPAEAAQLGLADAGNDAVVVIFDDESRVVWPDDWKSPPARPRAGDRVVMPGRKASEDPGRVREVLDFLTGQQLEVWTDADEDAEAAAADLAADLDAVAALESGRGGDADPWSDEDEDGEG